jgi:hypothetical protein
MGTYSESCLKYNIKKVCLLHFESLQNELKCCIHLSAKGVFYYLRASENWPDKRGGFWWEWPYKRGGFWWEWPYKRGGFWWEWPYKKGGFWWEYLTKFKIHSKSKILYNSPPLIRPLPPKSTLLIRPLPAEEAYKWTDVRIDLPLNVTQLHRWHNG